MSSVKKRNVSANEIANGSLNGLGDPPRNSNCCNQSMKNYCPAAGVPSAKYHMGSGDRCQQSSTVYTGSPTSNHQQTSSYSGMPTEEENGSNSAIPRSNIGYIEWPSTAMGCSHAPYQSSTGMAMQPQQQQYMYQPSYPGAQGMQYYTQSPVQATPYMTTTSVGCTGMSPGPVMSSRGGAPSMYSTNLPSMPVCGPSITSNYVQPMMNGVTPDWATSGNEYKVLGYDLPSQPDIGGQRH